MKVLPNSKVKSRQSQVCAKIYEYIFRKWMCHCFLKVFYFGFLSTLIKTCHLPRLIDEHGWMSTLKKIIIVLQWVLLVYYPFSQFPYLGVYFSIRPIYCDNECAVGLANDVIIPKMSKSIDMRFHWLKDRVKQGQFQIFHIPGLQNAADFLTKSLPVVLTSNRLLLKGQQNWRATRPKIKEEK